MGLGKKTRINRLFGHPSGRMCSAAIDHFVAYHLGMPEGLANLPRVIASVVAGEPDAITMTKGTALLCWPAYAGKIPLIIQSLAARPDDSADQQLADPKMPYGWAPMLSPFALMCAVRPRPCTSAVSQTLCGKPNVGTCP